MSRQERLKIKQPDTRRLSVLKNFVIDTASLSKCTERKVAAIIADKNLRQVYSIGVNGGAAGQEDCLCCIEGKYGCLHAEINCLISCPTNERDRVMILTLAPCKQCAAAIVNSPGSFSTVYYCEDWKEQYGLEMLRTAGINVVKL